MFAGLDRAGVLAHHIPGVEAIEQAITEPPELGRARIRGEVIRRLAGQNGIYQCDWQGIFDVGTNRLLDLSQPFEAAERWIEYEQAVTAGQPAFAALLTRLDGDFSRRF